MPQRRKIPKQLKDAVRERQSGRCCCCISRGKYFHHVNPVKLFGSNQYFNLVLLCKDCHNLQTCKTILEYVYYLYHWELPDDESLLDEVEQFIRENHVVPEGKESSAAEKK